MKTLLLSTTIISLAVSALAAPQCGDITAAVRASGYAPAISSIPATGQAGSCANTGLFDGLLSFSDAGYPSGGQRFFFQWSASSTLTLNYAMPEQFCPGEDIVVTALVFAVGRAGNSGTPSYFTNYDKRMPKAWTLEGSNDGSVWTQIAAAENFGGYTMSKNGTADDVYSGTCDIANTTSYRQYRITVTDNTGDATYMTQLTEVKLLGFYGGKYEYTAAKVDLTAMARRTDGSKAFVASAPNLSPYASATSTASIDKAFDGLCTAGGFDRFLATADSTKAAFEDGGAIIEYEFTEGFANQGDVIVTGYTLDTYTGHGSALERMPTSWALEAYDETKAEWIVLDRYDSFGKTIWETRVVDGCDQYLFDFSFANSASYRKYRFRISALNVTSSPQVQFSEIRLHGYVGKGIAGTVGGKGESHPVDITAWGRQYFTPVIGTSDYAAIQSGTSTECLWDGLFSQNFVLYTLNEGQFPFCINYEIPDSMFSGADFIVKGYTFSARKDLGNRDNRMPFSWRLEGYSEEQQRWIAIDKRSSYESWTEDDSKNRIFADFTCAENACAFRKYRIKVSSVKAKSNNLWQLALQEIELRGEWGKSIAEPPLPPQGLLLLFR